MHAEIVRLSTSEVDLKVILGERMHVLQWRRHLLHDEVLLDGKTQATSYGLWGREKVYGLVFGSDPEDKTVGERVMLIVDPANADNWTGMDTRMAGVRLETASGPLIAYGSLDPNALKKPSTFAEWMKKSMGMEWGDSAQNR